MVDKIVRPLHNAPFSPISVSGSNYNPRNTQCIPVVKIFAFLDLEQNLAFFKGLIVSRFYIKKPNYPLLQGNPAIYI